jgi:hypothetical protein
VQIAKENILCNISFSKFLIDPTLIYVMVNRIAFCLIYCFKVMKRFVIAQSKLSRSDTVNHETKNEICFILDLDDNLTSCDVCKLSFGVFMIIKIQNGHENSPDNSNLLVFK